MSLPTPYISDELNKEFDDHHDSDDSDDQESEFVFADLSEHTYDIVVYGATGLVGTIASKYIYDNYKEAAKVVLSGRTKDKLTDLNKRYKMDIFQCESSDYEHCEKLVSLLKPTGCLLNLAGPYLTSGGSNLTRACVEAGVSVCDISGEVPFCRDNITKHHDEAAKKKVRIVKFAGHDSLFFGMVVNKLAEHLKTKGEELSKVELYDDIHSKPSHGTIKTAFNLRKDKSPKIDGADPLMYLGGGVTSEHSVQNRSYRKWMTTSTRPDVCAFLTPFFMAGVNCCCVKRDNAILGYGKNVEYIEGQAFDSIMGVMWHYVSQLWAYFMIMVGWYRNPTTKEMDEMYLDVVGVGTGTNGTVAKVVFSVDGDPGYLHTATACVETALCIALDHEKLAKTDHHFGVISPAILNDTTGVLMDRLINCPAECFDLEVNDGDEQDYSSNYKDKDE